MKSATKAVGGAVAAALEKARNLDYTGDPGIADKILPVHKKGMRGSDIRAIRDQMWVLRSATAIADFGCKL